MTAPASISVRRGRSLGRQRSSSTGRRSSSSSSAALSSSAEMRASSCVGAPKGRKSSSLRCFANGQAISRADPYPIQVCHHLIDVGGCLRAEIEMIGMLVHVEREDRGCPWQAVCVVCRPLVDEPAQALRPGEDHPAGAACQRLCHGGKLVAPGRDAAEITLERLGEFGRRLSNAGGRTVAVSAERTRSRSHAGSRSRQQSALRA